MEPKGLEILSSEIDLSFQPLREEIQGSPEHFVLNADEMGHQEWANLGETLCDVCRAEAENAQHVIAHPGLRRYVRRRRVTRA
jgi:hypothetical protein